MASAKRRGRPRGSTKKGESTRQLLYEAATQLFAERGYEATTMRAIADRAGVSPGLLYRYFPSKRAVVQELYQRLSTRYATDAAALPEGSWTLRFFHALDVSLAVLAPHRDTLAALTPLLIGDADEGLFATGSAKSRRRVMAVFVDAVDGATDAPNDAAALGRLLYVAHLAIILSWLLDKSPEQRATMQLLEQLASFSGMAALAVLLPQAETLVAAGDRFCREGLFGE